MLRSVSYPVLLAAAAVLLPAAPARAALLPDQVAGFQKGSSKSVPVSPQRLWDEYGFKGSEQAEYAGEGGHFTLTAWQFGDSTGAFGAFQWQRPADAKASKLTETAAESGTAVLAAYGNYLLRFDGWKPGATEFAQLTDRLPKFEKSPLPVLRTYLPAKDLVPNSERYMVGPVGLAQFDPKVPPSAAAFRMGAEGQAGRYKTPQGELEMAIFSYPTPHIARDQLPVFEKLPGAMAKRSGPFVAVVMNAPNADEAEKLLASVKYEAEITLSERVPTRRDNIGDLILNIFELIGILLVFCAAAGLGYAGLRMARLRWMGAKGGGDALIVLGLRDR